MKKLKFLRTVPGAALTVAIIATSGVGAYALNNWFNGAVTVNQTDSSILSVDLSDCKGRLPAGVSDNVDRHMVQFKILGSPHIAAANLQTKLLEDCEYSAVQSFYLNKPAAQSDALIVNTSLSGQHDSLNAGTIQNIGNDGTLTLNYAAGSGTAQKSFRLASNATVYDQGQPSTLQTLRAGDAVMFEAKYPTGYISEEGVDGLTSTSTVQSIFKTKYNVADAPSASKSGFLYGKNNIMPLDMYNQLHK